MKKLLFAFIAALLVAVALVPNVAAAEQVSPTQNDEIVSFVEELCDFNNLDSESVREFLTEKFNQALDGKAVVERKSVPYEKEYVNLEAKLTKNGATKQIIIGAHYDVAENSEGAADNACGVAAMYLIMQQLAKNVAKLPCNVTFVAFDAEEMGLLGSQYYVNKTMTQTERNNTLVMFNIDTIVTGDNLYLMCENKRTDLAKLILSNAEGFKEKPYARGTFGNAFDVFGYGYYEMVQGSDHTPFRLAGIPTALLFSGTYSAKIWGYSESSNDSVINSSNDTFDNLLDKYPNFDKRIEAVAQAVTGTVTDESFLSVAENARKQLVNLKFWYTIWWPILAVVVIGVVVIVLAVFYYRKLQKNAILGESEIKTQKVFEKPAAEDIFTFKTDDSDDIFTFKK